MGKESKRKDFIYDLKSGWHKASSFIIDFFFDNIGKCTNHKTDTAVSFFLCFELFFIKADVVFNSQAFEKAANNEVCRCLRQSFLGRSSKINLVVIAPNWFSTFVPRHCSRTPFWISHVAMSLVCDNLLPKGEIQVQAWILLARFGLQRYSWRGTVWPWSRRPSGVENRWCRYSKSRGILWRLEGHQIRWIPKYPRTFYGIHFLTLDFFLFLRWCWLPLLILSLWVVEKVGFRCTLSLHVSPACFCLVVLKVGAKIARSAKAIDFMCAILAPSLDWTSHSATWSKKYGD